MKYAALALAPRVALSLATLFVGATVIASCSDKKATALTIAISSEAAIPTEIDEMSLVVYRGSDPHFAEVYPLAKANSTIRLPATLTLQPLEDESPSDPITIKIRANIAKQEVVLRSATIAFVEERTKLLRLPLRYSCYDFPIKCGDGTTCIGGACKDDHVDAAKLPDLGSGDVFPATGSTACFDSADTACAKNRVDIDDIAAFTSAGCTFETQNLGGSPAANLNVFVLWEKSLDQAHLTVLDQEPLSTLAEGWSYVDGSTSKLKLAPSLCDLVVSGDIRKVAFNRACATKTIDTPVCTVTPATNAIETFSESPCHTCVYTPSDCSAELDAAKAEAASGPLLECAFACPYDGHYDTKDECNGVGGCFFGCLAPFIHCADTSTCDQYAAASTWSSCVNALTDPSTRCASACSDEGISSCSVTP